MFCWRSDGTLTPTLDPWDSESSKPTTSLCGRVSHRGARDQKGVVSTVCRQLDKVGNQPLLGGIVLPLSFFGWQGCGALGGLWVGERAYGGLT